MGWFLLFGVGLVMSFFVGAISAYSGGLHWLFDRIALLRRRHAAKRDRKRG
ncbi:hypothetical protein KX083_004883 [Escherichia coli]|nr:hypothetical protein [Escherichia coli]